MKRIKRFLVRSIAKVRIKNKERRMRILPTEQREVLRLSKSIIRQQGTSVEYSPLTSNILIKGNINTILYKNDEVIILSGLKVLTIHVDREIKDEVIEYISNFFERRINLVYETYRDSLRNLNFEFNE